MRDTMNGNGKVEYRRELAKVEAEERERVPKLCETAIRYGLDDRKVRLAEEQGPCCGGHP